MMITENIISDCGDDIATLNRTLFLPIEEECQLASQGFVCESVVDSDAATLVCPCMYEIYYSISTCLLPAACLDKQKPNQ